MNNGPNFELMKGQIPVVIQDHESDEVLMVGYMDPQAWVLTLREGKVHYYSRKKQRIWLKGEQSGHFQNVREVFLNCDRTCVLIKVEQVGGACDLGLKSCFDKVLQGGEFKSAGREVFDPHDAYGENFTSAILLGIPTGSLEKMTLKLLELAGYETRRESTRSYSPEVANCPDLRLCMARAEELPLLVGEGRLDAAVTGMDMIQDAQVSVRDLADLGYNKLGRGPVLLALAIPCETTMQSLQDLEGRRVATAYQNLTRRFFGERRISVHIVPSIGATEGKVPLLADAVVELVETGETLRANHLRPVLKVHETTAHLVANNESWGYTWKRRNLEEISGRLTEASQQLPQNPKQCIDIATHLGL